MLCPNPPNNILKTILAIKQPKTIIQRGAVTGNTNAKKIPGSTAKLIVVSFKTFLKPLTFLNNLKYNPSKTILAKAPVNTLAIGLTNAQKVILCLMKGNNPF